MGKGGGSSSAQSIPQEFQPAYYRLFNSAFGAAQQGAQNPFGQQGGGQGIVQGQNQMFPQLQQMRGVQIPGVGQFGGAGGAAGGAAVPQNAAAGTPPGTYSLPIRQQQGAAQIPLSQGGPIIGEAYQGPFTAPTTPIEQESLAAREMVGRQLQGLASPLLGLGQQQASGAFLNPNANPYFASNIEASLAPAIDAFGRTVAPQFGSQALQQGLFKGSSARDMAFGNLANDFGRNLLNTAAQTGYQNYLQERQIQQQTPQLLQQAAGLQQLTPEILAQVGAGQRELLQRPLDEQLLQFQEAQQAPFRPLGPLASIIQGTNIGTTSTLQAPRPSPLASGIAGGLGGASLGLGAASQLGLGTGGSAGAGGLGALLGALGGIFG